MCVPDPAPARWLIWGAIAVGSLYAWAAPVTAPVLGPAPGPGGCALERGAPDPGCPCADWPGRVRLLAGRPLPLRGVRAIDLEALPGIGPARAAAIAAAGPFDEPSGLLAVPGIGPRTLERLRPWLSADPPDCAGVDWS